MTVDLSIPDPSLGALGAAVPKFEGGSVRDVTAFRARLEAFQLHVTQHHAALVKRVTAETLRALVLANPVGNPIYWKRPRKGYVGGHSRRNWQVSVAGGQPTEVPGVDPQGNMSMAQGNAVIGAMQPGQSAHLVNPVPYMERLAQGWSKQAAAGWIDAILHAVWDKYTRVR